MNPLYGQKTSNLKQEHIGKNWVVIDAKDQILGRLSSAVAKRLLGKHLPHYQPGFPAGDGVIIINAKDIRVSGKKADQKDYYRYSGYRGGLRSRSFQKQMELDPSVVLLSAIKGMLPKSRYGKMLQKRVRIFLDDKHGMEAQKPNSVQL